MRTRAARASALGLALLLVHAACGAPPTPAGLPRQSSPAAGTTEVSFVIDNAIIVTMDGTGRVLSPGSIAVDGTQIVARGYKAKPGEIKFGSAGVGSGTHLAVEKFNFAAGIKGGHVPYKGGPEVNADMVAGKVLYWFPPLPLGMKAAKEGKLNMIGVTSGTRMKDLPDVPTIAESGAAAFGELWTWGGMWAPSGIPAAVKDKLVKDVALALASPDLREQLIKPGGEPVSMTPEEFSKFVRSEMESSAKLLKEAGIKPQ